MPEIQTPPALPSLSELIDNDGAGLPPKPTGQQQQQTPAEIAAAAATAKTEEDRKVAEQQQQQSQKTPEQIEQERVDALTPEQKEAERVAAESAQGEQQQEDLTVEAFFGQVDALRGDEVSKNIDYKGVDPMSPEGFLVRDQYIEMQAKLDFEAQIKESDPRAYAYLLHRQSGGSDDAFFAVKSFVLPALTEIKESVDLQRNVYQEALRAKGVPEKQVAVLLKASIDAGELAADAEAAHKEIKDRDDKVVEQATKTHAARIKEQQIATTNLDNTMNKIITEGKDIRFQIPQTEQARFAQAFKSNIHFENGEFYLIKPLTPETLAKAMETELFSFLGADLSKMVQKAAITASATKFITKAKAGEEAAKARSQQAESSQKTLGDL